MARGRFREFYQCDFDVAGTYPTYVYLYEFKKLKEMAYMKGSSPGCGRYEKMLKRLCRNIAPTYPSAVPFHSSSRISMCDSPIVHPSVFLPCSRMVPDAEVITVATEILSSLPIGSFLIKLNHRK